MVNYPNMNPIALQIGPIAIYWYGVMYLIGFAGAFGYCYYRRRLFQTKPWKIDEMVDLVFYCTIGVIFGGTWGYLLLYEPTLFTEDPMRALRFWEPGRSFHGGLVGVLIAILIFCRVHHRRFWAVTDFIAPAVPIGIAAGRLGNFINGELWGRVTTMRWGMVFPSAGRLPRHPSQLYEFGLEGVVLFLILHWYSKKRRPSGKISGLFLVGYGFFRFMIECFREPDVNLGFVAFEWLTMGQALSLFMILVGILILVIRRR